MKLLKIIWTNLFLLMLFACSNNAPKILDYKVVKLKVPEPLLVGCTQEEEPQLAQGLVVKTKDLVQLALEYRMLFLKCVQQTNAIRNWNNSDDKL